MTLLDVLDLKIAFRQEGAETEAVFTTFAIMLSLLVFIFEGVRDAFDPRKTFS